jgi:hypothetical protein
MSDPNISEETEEDEPTRCRKCGSHYNLRAGEDPTLYCDWCAHGVVEELAAKLASAERDAADARILMSRTTTVDASKSLRELADEMLVSRHKIMRERDDAISRAEAAEKERDAYLADAIANRKAFDEISARGDGGLHALRRTVAELEAKLDRVCEKATRGYLADGEYRATLMQISDITRETP